MRRLDTLTFSENQNGAVHIVGKTKLVKQPQYVADLSKILSVNAERFLYSKVE